MSDIVIGILTWIVFWFGVWGIYLYLWNNNFRTSDIIIDNFAVRNFKLVSLFFFVVSLILIFLFRDIFLEITRKYTFIPFIVLILALAADVFAYKYKKKIKLNKKINFPFFKGDYRYLVSKFFQILFQQVLIIVLIFSLLTFKFAYLVFMLIFTVSHLPLFPLFGKKLGAIFLISSAFGALIFPFLILKFNYGFVYSFAAHSLFYTLLAEMFWHTKAMKN